MPGKLYAEYRLTWRASVDSAFPKKDSGKRSAIITTLSDKYSSLEQVVGTSPEAIEIPAEVIIPTYFKLINLDSTNFITYGVQGNLIFKLKAGEHCFFHGILGKSYYAQADTANVRVKVIAVSL